MDTTVILKDADAERLKVFLVHYPFFAALIDSGAFDTKNGSVTLNFDSSGILAGIKRDAWIFKRT